MLNWITITTMICLGIYGLSQLGIHVIVPMFNAYLQYKIELREFDSVENRPLIEYEKGLQRENDGSDSPSEIGESDDRSPVHDERL